MLKQSHRLALWLALFVLALVPFAFCNPLPLVDYPNHMARLHIIANIDSSAHLQKYYDVDWQSILNLAMDLLVPPLAPVLSVETATGLFAALTLFLLAFSPMLLHWVLHKNTSLFPLFAFLFLYNRQFIFGFLNYLFAVGCAIAFFAVWICTKEWSMKSRLLVFSPAALLLYFFHLHAFGIYAVLVVTWEASDVLLQRRIRSTRAFAAAILPVFVLFLAPAACFLSSPTAGRGDDAVVFRGLYNEVVGILNVFNNYDLNFDGVTILVVFGIFTLGLLLRAIRIHPTMVAPLAALAALYLALPFQLFSGSYVDRRIAPVLFLLFVASSDWSPTVKAVTRRAATTVLLAVFALRMAVVAVNWSQAQLLYERYMEAIDRIEIESRVLVIVGSYAVPAVTHPPVVHIANLAVVRRDAFVNSLFAHEGQQILQVKYPAAGNFQRDPSQAHILDNEHDKIIHRRVNLFDVPLNAFDYVLIVNPKIVGQDPPDALAVVVESENLALYRVL